jgi:phosphopantothenoylcysteine decarboxylase/phosphopantothenate--cysteine ligase
LLGVCGGIAAYKAAALTSALVQRGDTVRVVMTREAREFVAPLTFAALSGEAVHSSLWEAPESIPHIRLVREADVFAIVPATANALAKLAHGIADDLLTNAALAARIPIVVAPAMNEAMYEHPATRANLAALRSFGYTIVEPGAGFLAERELGIGRLAEQDAIVAAIDAAGVRSRELDGECVLITAGPTREAIDPVRFLSNASTGTMGIELAREALARGAAVELVLGPTLLEAPAAVRVTRVTTAQEMAETALALAPRATVAIATAAVSDWRPATTHAQKVKKSDGPQVLELERTPDVLQALGERERRYFLVGFAAETERHEEHARAKLVAKRLDAIVVNDVSRAGSGFGTAENEATVLWGVDGQRPLGRASKREIARRLWDALRDVRSARA